MIIRDLITRFGFDVDEKVLKDLENGVEGIKFGLIGIAGVAATAAASLYGIVKVSANGADELNRAALSAGTGVETLQKLGYAATMSGSSVEELSQALRFLSRNTAQAAQEPWSDVGQTFRKLGISVKDSAGHMKTSDQVFLDLSRRFQTIRDPAKKVQITMDLLGRSGAGMIEMLNKGPAALQRMSNEAEAFGVMTQDQVDTLREFNDALNRVFWIFGAIRNQIAAKLAPVLTDMINQFRDYLFINREIIKRNLTGFLNGVISVTKVLWRFTSLLARAFAFLADKMGGVEFITKALLFSILFLSGMSVVAGVMTLAYAFWALAGAIGMAVLEALIIPALITAAIVAVGLLIEDLWTFVEGGDSFTGMLISGFMAYIGWIERAGKAIADWILHPLQAAYRLLDWIGKSTGQWDMGAVSGAMGFGDQASTGGRSVLPAGAAGSTVSIHAPVSVEVPPGTPPDKVGQALQDGMQLAMETVFGVAYRATAGGVVQ